MAAGCTVVTKAGVRGWVQAQEVVTTGAKFKGVKTNGNQAKLHLNAVLKKSKLMQKLVMKKYLEDVGPICLACKIPK